MKIVLPDPDEYRTVVKSTPCTSCGGDLSKCDGGCNGSMSVGQERRSPEEVAAIKAQRRREYEDKILAEAELIRASRAR